MGSRASREAIEAVFPRTVVQTCIVHLIRSSTRFVAWVNRKASDRRPQRVYRADTEEAALAALTEFEKRWGERYPMVAPAWRSNWERVRPFFAFGRDDPPDHLHDQRDRIAELLAAKGHAGARPLPERRGCAQAGLPGDPQRGEEVDTAAAVLEPRAMNQFAIHFEGRLPA